MTRGLLPFAALVLSGFLLGCARHVVADPRAVTSLNDPDWKVISEPSSATPANANAALQPTR